MATVRSLVFKIASEDWEFEQIHRLNYMTFVEEIPQHEQNASETLVDQFHEENTYFICLDDREVVGMIALRAKRPFSLDKKLENLDAYLPPGRSVCEIRLLSVPSRTGRASSSGGWRPCWRITASASATIWRSSPARSSSRSCTATSASSPSGRWWARPMPCTSPCT